MGLEPFQLTQRAQFISKVRNRKIMDMDATRWVGTSMSCLQALKQKLRSRCILCSPDSARAESGHRAKQGVEMGKKFFLLALVNGINERGPTKCEF